MELQGFTQVVALAGTLAGAILSAVAVLALLRKLYRASIGRRGFLERRLAKMAPTQHYSYVEELLGLPPFSRPCGDYTQYVWVEPELYTTVLADADGNIALLSATVRRRWPRLYMFRGLFVSLDGRAAGVKLGKTTFAQVNDEAPISVKAFVGARHFQYNEAYYLGNPGFYLNYVYSVHDGGYSKADLGLVRAVQEAGSEIRTGSFAATPADVKGERDTHSAALGRARRTAVINTMTVIDDAALLTHVDDWIFGPNADQVRVLPAEYAGLLTRTRLRLRMIRTRAQLRRADSGM